MICNEDDDGQRWRLIQSSFLFEFASSCFGKNREMVSKKHRDGVKKHGVGWSSKMRGELPIDNIFCILPKLWPICYKSPLSTQFKSKRTLRRYWWFVTKYEDIRLCQKHNKKMLPTGHVLWVGQKQMFCKNFRPFFIIITATLFVFTQCQENKRRHL